MDEPRTRKRRHRFGARLRDPSFVRVLAIYTLAAASIVVGIAGLILPVLPGWPFIILGLVLLAGVNRPIRGWLHRFLNGHPKIDRAYLAIRRAPVKGKSVVP